jgi:hypothetical protein
VTIDIANAREHAAGDIKTQLAEVVGQRKLLKWSVPGAAHAAMFWGFIVLLLTIIEPTGPCSPAPSPSPFRPSRDGTGAPRQADAGHR